MAGGEPPAPDVSKVVVRDSPSFGRCAFAAVDIPAGELVLAEDPVLTFDTRSSDAVVEGVLALAKRAMRADTKHEGRMIHEEDWASGIGLYLAFCRAPQDVQQLILQEMQGTPQQGMEAAQPIVRARIQAATLASLAPEINKMLEAQAAARSAAAAGKGEGGDAVPVASGDAAVIQQVLTVMEINVHRAGNAGAINHLGSKLTHTCGAPNTYYQSFSGRCCHVALRDIAAGELLTTSYIPASVNIMFTTGRQQFLRDRFAFQCACERCSQEVDKLCSLPCQRCAVGDAKRSAADGNLPVSLLFTAGAAGGKTAGTGLLQWDPTKAAPFDPASLERAAHHHHHHHHHDGCCGHDHSHDHDHGADEDAEAAAAAAAATAAFKPWRCSKCAAELPDIDLELVGDYMMIRQASDRLADWSYAVARQFDPEEDEVKLRHLLQIMGPYHASVHFCFNAQTDLWRNVLHQICGMIQAATTGLPDDALRGLRNASQGIEQNQKRTWAWLTRWCGISPEAASKMLFEVMALNACSLLVTSALIASKLHGGTYRQLGASMKQAGLDLLEQAEPGLAQLRRWKPCKHPLVTEVDNALAALAGSKGVSKEPAVAAKAPLDMQQLMDFLPAAPAGGRSGGNKSGGGKGKAKKGGGKKK